MTNLTQFQFKTKDIRIIEKDGQPWFVASDVCKILEIVNGRDTVKGFPSEEKDAVGITDTIGRTQQMTVISEPGLYRLIFQSRKKEAEEFKTWVVSEVLPQIRKTGSYKRELSLEEQTLNVIHGLTARIQEMTPKAEFFDTVADAKGDRTIMDTAKLLKIEKPRKLYEMLRNDGITMVDNIPYQQYIYQGYFRVNVSVNNGYTNSTTYVTNKGLVWLQKKYKHLHKEMV